MDKETLSNYGWIVICILVLAVMLALATPFGNFIATAVKSTTAGFFSVNQSALNSTGLMNIGDQQFQEPNADGGEGEITPVTGTPALYDETGAIIKTWEELVDEGKVFVEGTTLTRINITEGYRLVVPGTIKTYAAKTYYDSIWNDETFEYEDVPAAFGFKVLEFQSGLEKVACNMYGCGDIERIIFPDTVTAFDSAEYYDNDGDGDLDRNHRYCWDNCYFTIEYKGNEYHTMNNWEEFNSLPECYVDYDANCDCNWYIDNGWNINIEENHKECISGAITSHGAIHFT